MINSDLGQYRIEAELGRGGMGTVYKAFHRPLRRYVALKVLDPVLSRSPEFQQRFEQEATIAAQLDHPNIVAVYDLGIENGYQYIAMRLIEGPTLDEVISKEGPLPLGRALHIASQVADALDFAHQAGVLHRDVKPSNVMLPRGDRAILADFGIARAAEGLRLTISQSVVGTPRYMSPEQAMAQPLDRRSDLYALGIVLYEMLAGRPPFDAASTPALLYKHVHEAPSPIWDVRPDLPPSVLELLERSLAKRPEDRFQSGASFAEACRRALEEPVVRSTLVLGPSVLGAPGPATPPPPAGTPEPGRSTPAPISPRPPQQTPGASGPGQGPLTPGAAGPVRGPEPAGLRPFTPPAHPAVPPPADPAGWTAAIRATTAPELEQRQGSTRGPAVWGASAVVGVLLAAGVALAFDLLPPPLAELVGRQPAPTATRAPAPTSAPATAVAILPTATIPLPSTPVPPATPAQTSVPTATSLPEPARRLVEAREAVTRKEWQSALDSAGAGMKVDPAFPGLAQVAIQAHLALADEHRAAGRLPQAEAGYRAVLEAPLRESAAPAELRAAELGASYVGGELAWERDPATAVERFQQVYDLDSSYLQVREKLYALRIALADQQLDQGNGEAAVEHLLAAREVDPERPEASARLLALTPTPVPLPPTPVPAPRQPAPARPAPAEPAPAPAPEPTPPKVFVPPPPPDQPLR